MTVTQEAYNSIFIIGGLTFGLAVAMTIKDLARRVIRRG